MMPETSMNSKLGVPLILILLFGSVYSYVNDTIIDEWLEDNVISVQTETVPILSLQDNERWLVLVVDFPDRKFTQQQAISSATDLIKPAASQYIHQMSRGSSSLTVDIHPTLTTASENLAYFGEDFGGEKDTTAGGKHGPMQLANEVLSSRLDEVNWDDYDLDDDGIVDRVLILHTSIGQEVGGNSNRIWSHFTLLDDVIETNDGTKISHYTMAALGSGENGFGTAIHEMMHQMGAYDLYPSHTTSGSSWKGIGDWDIMASGNWNQGGKTPSLPSASTLETIGSGNIIELDMNWLYAQDSECLGLKIEIFDGISNYKQIKVPIAKDEYVWIEYRSKSGYDAGIPASGTLVYYQDKSVEGFDDNSLNVDKRQPYLYMIESDGRGDLLLGNNEGESSDVFSNNTMFGNQGIEIRTHDGLLVQWIAKVNTTNGVVIEFDAASCSSKFELDIPNHGISLLRNQSFQFFAKSEVSCPLSTELTSSDGRLISVIKDYEINQIGSYVELQFNSAGNSNSVTTVSGLVVCGDSSLDLKTTVLTLGTMPINSTYETDIPVTENVQITIPITAQGDRTQSFELHIDGPLSRIASGPENIVLDGNDDFITIDINPNNLLSHNMIIRGEIELTDSTGKSWKIEVKLNSKSDSLNTLSEIINPGQMISIALLLAAFWVYLSMKDPPVQPELDMYFEDRTENTIKYSQGDYFLPDVQREMDKNFQFPE